MFENKNTTPLSELGEFGLIDHLTKNFPIHPSTHQGYRGRCRGDEFTEGQTVCTTILLIEGIHFDLSYVPLKHLGYKAVMVNLSDVYAMNAHPLK